MIGNVAFREIFDVAADAMFILDQDGLILEVNQIAYEQLGYTKAEMVGRAIADFVPPPLAAATRDRLANVRKHGYLIYESAMVRKDGSVLPVEIGNKVIEHAGGNSYYGVARDISERKRLDQALKESEARFRTLSEDAPEAIVIHDLDTGKFIDATTSAERLFACERDEILQHGPEYFFAPDQPEGTPSIASIQERGQRILAGEQMKFERLIRNGKGQDIFCEVRLVRLPSANANLIRASYLDITERKMAADKIEHLAFYDSLTDLPNRRLMLDRLDQALIASNRSAKFGVLMILDLDNFKAINDTKGHDVGDRLLIEVAHRIVSSVRPEDTVSRLGGDEYVVLVEALGPDETLAASRAEMIAEKIRIALTQPYALYRGEPAQHSTSSIGVTLFRGNELAIDILLKQADMALYQAKGAGRNTIRFFNPAMQAVIESRSRMEAALRNGLQNGEFQLHYQPKVDQEGRTNGAEALLRWMSADQGQVSPVNFIPLAENTGIIIPLGLWVMQTACAQLKAWSESPGTCDLQISINVSARQFHEANFVGQVFDSLKQSGANPKLLKLELTESVVLEDVEDVITRMQQIKALGVTFSLDDFGTGFSSLSYLKRLPLDEVKIDQSFVRDVTSDANDAAIVRAIIAMSRSLGIQVIAEGVETEEQLHFLKENGCMNFQGYLFGKPMQIEELNRLL